jgi:flagellar motility protein MotE (MotC chaperone)
MRQQLIKALEEIKRVNEKYGLSGKAIDECKKEIEGVKVCAPIVGPFSSGKSALLNRLLGYDRRHLREDITPETAVPAELVYSEIEGAFDTVKILYKDGRNEILPLPEFHRRASDEAFFGAAHSVRFRLKNDFLKSIPDVMPVDMPGFGSGNGMHDKAIDDYAARSMIYLVAFPAPDMILRTDLGDMLKELCRTHGIPIAVAITKCDQAPPAEQFEAALENLRRQLKKYADGEFEIYLTSSRDGEVDGARTFFEKVQKQSGKLIGMHCLPKAEGLAKITCDYLRTRRASGRLSESELLEHEERIKAQLSELEKKAKAAAADFERQTENIVEEIKADVSAALEGRKSALAAMILSGGSEKASEHMNATVRAAAAESVKKRYVGRMEKYLERVNEGIRVDAGLADAENVAGAADAGEFENVAAGALGGGVVGGIAAAAGVAALPAFAALPALTLGALTIPVIGVALAGLGAVIGAILNMGKGKEDQKEQEIRARLSSQVFPDILRQVGENLERALGENMNEIENTVDERIAAQRAALEKALDDNRARRKIEKAENEAELKGVEEDLTHIETLLSRLREAIHAA